VSRVQRPTWHIIVAYGLWHEGLVCLIRWWYVCWSAGCSAGPVVCWRGQRMAA